MRTRMLFILGLLAAFSATACKKASAEESSAVKYGYLTGSENSLVALKSGSVINICGAYYDYAVKAITTWGNAIGRQYSFASNCQNATINVYGIDDPFAVRTCREHGVKTMYARLDTRPMQIVDCNPSDPLFEATMLHEVGHLFGLCDQYDAAVHNCLVTTSPEEGSVMRNADKTYLTNDDIVGIQNLANQVPVR